MPHPDAEYPDWYDTAINLPYTAETKEAILALLQRSWFFRVWIWQEIRISHRSSIIQAGRFSMSWLGFIDALNVLERKPEMFKYSAIVSSISMTVTLAEQLGALELLDRCCEALCSNPKDKVYGTLGLWPRSISDTIQVDYSLPVGEIYTSFHRALITAHRRLDHLGLCNPNNARYDAPSWVLDLEKPGTKLTNMSQLAAGFSPSVTTFIDGTNQLEASGVICGTINNARTIPTAIPDILKTAQDFAGSAGLNDTKALEDFATALVLGTNRIAHAMHVPDISVIKRALLAPKFADLDSEDVSHLESRAAWLAHGLVGEQLVRLDNGTLGVGTFGCSVGDCVAVLLGCDMPVVLHPSLDGNTYRVVGVLFTAQLSDAKALLGPLGEGWRAVQKQDDMGEYQAFFVDGKGEVTSQDPRLGMLPDEWEGLEYERGMGDPAWGVRYRDRRSGEEINYDPRMTAEALKERGVRIEKIMLV